MAEAVSSHVEYEKRDGVGIWDIDDMVTALESGALETAEEHFREVAGQPSMNGVVIVVGGADNLPKETLEHVNEKWTELGEDTDVDAAAYVADGIAKLAISNKNEAEGLDTRGFDDIDAALEWAADY